MNMSECDCDFNAPFTDGKNELHCDWCGDELDPETEPTVTHSSGQKQYTCGGYRCEMCFHAYNQPCNSCGWWHTNVVCEKCGFVVPGESLPRPATAEELADF
jgi:hypothetical protein